MLKNLRLIAIVPPIPTLQLPINAQPLSVGLIKNDPYLWVRVDAEVGSGTEKCRRVVVGTEEVLKYAFECDEVSL